MYQCYIHNYFIVNLFLIMSFTFLDICLRNLKLEVSCHKFFWEYEGFYMFIFSFNVVIISKTFVLETLIALGQSNL